MSAVQDGFRKTLTGFRNRLTKEQLEDVQCNSLSDLQVLISRIQYEQRDQKQLMNMNRIKAFLEAMEQFEQVIKVFLNTSQFVAFIWGPIKFLLQVGYAD
jgi:transposase-like protein